MYETLIYERENSSRHWSNNQKVLKKHWFKACMKHWFMKERIVPDTEVTSESIEEALI